MATNFDVLGVKNELIAKSAQEFKEFYRGLFEAVAKKNNLNLNFSPGSSDEALIDRVVEAMAAKGISLKTGTVEPAVMKIYKETIAEGDRYAYVETFLNKGEIDKTKITPSVKKRMVRFLMNRGTVFTKGAHPTIDAAITAGIYDEHFMVAYDHALAGLSGEQDPLASTTGKGEIDPDLWDFTVSTFDDLEEKGIIRDNILAAGAIDYVYELGERMGVFRLADAVVLNWSSGSIDIVDGPAAAKLYRYWKVRDQRCSNEERGMLYKRVLNKGNERVLSRMVVNKQFTELWRALMEEVAKYIEKSERLDEGVSEMSPVSRRAIYKATRELQYNLTEFCTGMAHMKVREIYAQLNDAMDILGDEEVMAYFGGTRRKSVWTVIEELSKSEFNESPNVSACRTLAVDGNTIFRWIADFNEGAVVQDDFINFIHAAESYILTAASADLLSGEPKDEDSEDDFGDDDIKSDEETDSKDDDF